MWNSHVYSAQLSETELYHFTNKVKVCTVCTVNTAVVLPHTGVVVVITCYLKRNEEAGVLRMPPSMYVI